MTTGQKLSQLRKEHNYTQEQLGELLDVSRQSISKWESDLAFPETQKLIELSKLYDCSLDYLLGNETIHTTNLKSKSFEMTPKLFTMIWSISYFVIMLILYALPAIKLTIQTPSSTFPFTGTELNINVSTYNLLENGPGQLGNLIIFIAFFALIGMLILGILIYVQNNPKYYKIRRIAAIIEVSCWLLFTILFISHVLVGTILICLVSLAHVITLYKVPNNSPQSVL